MLALKHVILLTNLLTEKASGKAPLFFPIFVCM